ncbi:MAG: DUF2505 domain-containing protein [Nocardioides sp.]|uniref:DUF2505 domain-containing protein n=1 Tax=Nocardioides sp. TaxID=35761 RepID=UPI0039E2CF48
MTTTLSYSTTYAAPFDEVRAMVLDAAFREQVCEAQHAVSHSVRLEGNTVEVDYAQSTERAPSFARKLVGDTLPVSQRERWTGGEATVTVTVPGKPGAAEGTIHLVDLGDSTRQDFRLSVTARIPLVGGRVESLIKDLLLKAFEREARVGHRWLAG